MGEALPAHWDRLSPGVACPSRLRAGEAVARRWLSHPTGASQTPGAGLPQQACLRAKSPTPLSTREETSEPRWLEPKTA